LTKIEKRQGALKDILLDPGGPNTDDDFLALCGERNRRLVERLKAEEETTRRWGSNSLHPNLPLLWVEGEDWLQREKVWLPFQLVHARCTAASHFDLRAFVNTSTGLASGNHLLDCLRWTGDHELLLNEGRAAQGSLRSRDEGE
jgi:hypothetical protein